MGNKRGVFFGLAVATLGVFLFGFFPGQAAATTGINQEMSFEGKLVDASGVNIPDGSYNMEFKIYTAAGSCNPTTGVGCTLGWTEDWLVSGGHQVTLTSGTFAVNLDDVAANNFSGIDFNSYPLYISIQIGSTSSCTPAGNFQANCGGDGEMKPYIKLTSSPYALNAGQLGGIAASGFVQLNPGSQQSGAVNISGTVTAGTYNTDTLTGSALTFGTAGTATIQPAAAQALTITGHAASTWSTDAGNLTIQAGSGTVSLGTSTILTAGGALTVQSGGASVLTLDSASGTVVSGAGDSINGAGGVNTGAGNGTQRIDPSGNLVNIGNVTFTSGNVNATLGAAGNTFTLQSSAGTDFLVADTANSKVVIGAAATDATQILLQLDSFSTYADTASCAATTNQGALYYNTNTNAIRGCINGGWEDVVSTAALGLQLFGVVPDSGSGSDIGDLAGATGLTDGPCKVAEGATTSTVSWKSCIAFSGGRKVIVAAGTATMTAGTSAANIWQHLCLTNSGQPALSAIGAETANLATVSMTGVGNPTLCLADIKDSNGSSVITGIYNTATYTTSTKEFASAITTAPVLGQEVKSGTVTPGSVLATSAVADTKVTGVIVASTGAISTNTINVVVAVNGPAWVKAITGTNAVGDFMLPTTTAGYANTAATFTSQAGYNMIGIARTAWTSACAINSLGCNSAILTNISPR